MARFAWLMVALVCFSFAGCGGGDDEAAKSDKTDSAAGTEVQGDLDKAGISEEEYAKRLKQSQGK